MLGLRRRLPRESLRREADGSDEIAKGWALLAHLCQVTLWPSEPNLPVRGGRSLVDGQ